MSASDGPLTDCGGPRRSGAALRFFLTGEGSWGDATSVRPRRTLQGRVDPGCQRPLLEAPFTIFRANSARTPRCTSPDHRLPADPHSTPTRPPTRPPRHTRPPEARADLGSAHLPAWASARPPGHVADLITGAVCRVGSAGARPAVHRYPSRCA